MRNQFYKVRLRFEKATLPVTVACAGIEKLEETVQQEMTFYTSLHGQFYGMMVDDNRVSVHLSDAEYEAEIAHCDIVQRDNAEAFFDPSTVQIFTVNKGV